MKIKLCRFIAFNRLVLREFWQKNCVSQAASLTFTTLLALVPLLFVTLTVITAFPTFSAVSEPIQGFIIKNFVPTASTVIQAYINKFAEHASKLSALGAAWLFSTAMMLMLTIEHTFNDIWRIRARRKTISVLLRYWAILTLTPICLAISFMITSHVSANEVVTHTAEKYHFINSLIGYIPILLGTLFFATLYTIVPNCPVLLRYSLFCGLLTTLLLGFAKEGLEIYLEHFPTYTLIYGAFAVVPLSLLWIHFAWTIVLLGAVLCHNLAERHRLRPDPQLDGFTHAYQWLGYLWQAQQQGQMLKMEELVERDTHGYQIQPEKLLDTLLRVGLITKNNHFKYALRQDLSQVNLTQLMQILPWSLPKPKCIQSYGDLGPWGEKLKTIAEAIHPKVENLDKPLAEFFRHSAAGPKGSTHLLK